MPEIIVRANEDRSDGAPIMLRERVSEDNLASGHFADQLIERIGWAVTDAAAAESDGCDERRTRSDAAAS